MQITTLCLITVLTDINKEMLETVGRDWCSLCGIVIYHYFPIEPNIVFNDDHIVFEPVSKEWKKRSRIRIMLPDDIRINDHSCNWFSLSNTTSWCTMCGRLKIKKTLMNNFKLCQREGFLMPVRRKARLKILRESGLVVI